MLVVRVPHILTITSLREKERLLPWAPTVQLNRKLTRNTSCPLLYIARALRSALALAIGQTSSTGL